MRPEVHRIQKDSLPTLEGSIPHIKRTFIRPPGFLERPEMLGSYGLYLPEEVDGAIEKSNLVSPGGKTLLRGLREMGGVALFGTGEEYDLGLNYGALYKTKVDEKIVPVLEELAASMQGVADKRGYSVHAVLAPETSGVAQAKVFSSFLKGTECHPVKKNRDFSPIKVALDSYTKGKTDILSLATEMLASLQAEGKTNIVLSDDIIDAGFMSQTVTLLLQLAQEQGYDVHLVGIVAPIEKTYTGAREHIQETLGDIPVISALQIEDIGLLNDTQAWIKVFGIPKAIPCNLADFRIKS